MKEGWEIRKLGDLTTALNGLWVGKKPPFVNIAVIRNTNFTKDCQLDTTDIAYIDAEAKHFSTRKLQCGDIIIEKSGGSDKQPVGRPVLFNIPEGDFSFSNFTSTLRINDQSDILPSFLHKALWAIYRSGKTASLQSKTTGIHNLDFKSYLKLPIPVPPIAEQEKIVAELDCLTGIIEKKKQQLEELDKLAQSIFYDMFGDDDYSKDSLISLCENNDDIKCGPFGTQLSKSEFVKEGVPVWGIPQINSAFSIPPADYVSQEKAVELRAFSVIGGDIVMSRKGNIGQSAIYPQSFMKGILHSDALRIRVKQEKANPAYLVFQFHFSPDIKHQFKSIGYGAVMPGLNVTKLKSVIVSVPPIDEQNEFAQKIESIEKQKALIKQSIAETETLFNSRMDYWFN